jgi:hypothetical protein
MFGGSQSVVPTPELDVVPDIRGFRVEGMIWRGVYFWVVGKSEESGFDTSV